MKLVALLVVLLLCSALSLAQIPRTMSYQGVLTDSTGTPKPDGSYSFTFRLYEASSGGSAVGTQQQTLQVKRGLFHTVFDQLLNGLSIDHPYWFSLQVESEPELSPRIPLTSVPYSISSIRADTAGYALTAPQQGFVDSARIAGTVADNSITSVKILDGTISFADIGQNGAATDQVMKWNGTAWAAANDSTGAGGGFGGSGTANYIPRLTAPTTLGNSVIYESAGKVGIGTINPQSPFVVQGASSWGVAEVVGNGTNVEASIGFRSSNTAKGGLGSWILGVNNNAGLANAFSLYAANGTGAGSQVISVSTSGNVGIGTGITLPAAKLHVNGNATIIGNVGIGTTGPSEQLEITGNFRLPTSTASVGVIKSGSDRFIHNYGTSNFFAGVNAGNLTMTGGNNTAVGFSALGSNTTGSDNTANGKNALSFNTTGAFNTANGLEALLYNTTGSSNTANGYQSLYSNTIGNFNTANGYGALYSNTTGYYNTANGHLSLFANTTGFNNTANGLNALYSNTAGSGNTASGTGALLYNTTGSNNTANGVDALNRNTTGFYNTANGVYALYGTTASQYNVAVGYAAGYSYDNGYNNVFLGANVDVSAAGLYNVIAVGQGTIVTANSTARFGNPATGSYGGWANWTNVSDARFKRNIQTTVPGIAFINKLRPVTYNLDATGLDAFLHRNEKKEDQLSDAGRAVHTRALQEKEAVTYTGFIAQEVETAARELGFDFSGVDAPKNENDTYGLRYAEFVVPLVKAVQEQQKMMETQQKEIEELKAIVKLLREMK